METIIFDWWWRSHQSLAHEGLRIFRFCVMPWKDEREPTIKYCLEDKLTWFKSSPQYRALDTIDCEPMEFEWNIFPGFTTLQLSNKVQEFLSKMSEKPEDSTGRIIFMSMFNDVSWGSQDNEQERELSANLVSIWARRFSPGRWSFLGPGSEKKWYSTQNERPQGEWDRIAELMMIKFSESGHPVSVPRVHCPEERSKAKEVENCQYTSALMGERLKLFFAQLFLLISSVSTEQSQILCEEYKAFQGDLFWQDNLTHCLCRQVRWWKHRHLRPMILRKKIYCKSNKIVWLSFVLMRDSWQRLTSDSISWWKTLKNFHNSQIQWLVVSPLCQEMKIYLNQKVGFEGNTKIGHVLEVTTCCLQGTYGLEIRIESLNKDHSHSWVRISRGLNKLVTDLSNKEDDDLWDAVRRLCVENECTCFCEPMKG